MSSDVESLRQSLTRLHAELSHAPQLDAASRALLADIVRDIERLNRAQPAPAERSSRQRRLETLAVQFEGEHPNLAAALREIVELLAQAGI
jgi:hypothetical protein